jgi:hypothetical protein
VSWETSALLPKICQYLPGAENPINRRLGLYGLLREQQDFCKKTVQRIREVFEGISLSQVNGLRTGSGFKEFIYGLFYPTFYGKQINFDNYSDSRFQGS